MTINLSEECTYYLKQTENTEINAYENLLRDIPDDIAEVFNVCRNVIEHYNGINHSCIDQSRYREIEIDKVADILSMIAAQGVTSIVERIPFEKKVIGNCFNISKLAVALLRHKSIPARLRYAYCTYFNHKNNPDVNSEQVLIEYWDFTHQQWRRGDPSMNWEILDHLGIKVDVDFTHVREELSQPICDVWINCRNHCWNFDDYGVSLGKTRRRSGMGHVALKLTHDFSCLNQVELNAFDFISPPKRFQEGINLRPDDFDKLAEVIRSGNFKEYRFTNKELPFSTLPRRVLRKSPLTGTTLKKRNIISESINPE